MFLKNSLKNIIRSSGKSILFFLLILIITIVQCLGISIWISIDNFLDECDNNYKTIGLLEYMGPEYPDDFIFDERMNATLDSFDFSFIEENENVLLWDSSYRALGYIKGLSRKDINAPLKDLSVVVLSDIGEYKRYRSNMAIVSETLYSSADYTGKAVLIDDFGFEAEKDHVYLAHGSLGYGKTSYRYFTPFEFSSESAKADGYTDSKSYMIMDITDDLGDAGLKETFEKIAETYRVINNSVFVHATGDITSEMQFHQQLLYISEGRSFTEDEYRNGEKVCIITEFIANDLGLSVGDRTTLSIAVAENTPVFESYWAGTGFAYEDEYVIVGICNTISEYTGNVYIPKSVGMDLSVNQIGYTIGTAVIDNDGADEFYSEIEPRLPDRVRMTIYDQGYSTVAEPFKKVLRIAIIISCTSIMAGIAVIILFGFLFIYRQRDVSDIMIKLGTGRRRTAGYFLYGSGIIALIGSTLGAVTGYMLSGLVVKIVGNSITAFEHTDRRYSISNLSISKSLEWASDLNPKVFIITGLSILIAAILSCLVFTLLTFRNKNKKRRAGKKLKRKGRSMILNAGPLKYTLISIMRSGQRSIITPVVAIGIVILVSQLTSTAIRYEKQLEQIYADSVISGQFMDINGRYYNNLVIDGFILHDIYESGYLEELHVTKSFPCHYVGRPIIDGVDQQLEPFEIPKGFSGETLLDKIKRGPKLILTNSISRAPEFYFSSDVKMEFLEGYDESFLHGEYEAPGPMLCMVTTDFLVENGVSLGDTIRLFVIDRKTAELDFLIVGSYVKEGTKDNVYCQHAGYTRPSLLTDSGDDERDELFKATYYSASFILKNAGDLGALKEYMADYGVSEINKIRTYRTFPVIDDKTFSSSVESFNQRIRQTEVLYPFIYSLLGVLAFILSFILILSRKKEIAVMRGLGTVKGRVFITFFTEQLILCLIGCCIGLIAWALFNVGFNSLQLILTAGFIGLFSLGGAVSLILVNRSEVLGLLGDEE